MRAAPILLVCATLFAAAPATQAQVVDMSKVSCKEFLQVDKDAMVMSWAWLYGYYSDEDADPVIDFAELAKLGAQLVEKCKANPGANMIKTAESVYEKK
jgi:acid stress chaperone HdeB